MADGGNRPAARSLVRGIGEVGRLIDTMTGAIVLLTLDGSAVQLNRAALELAGRPAEDLAGVPLWTLPMWAGDRTPDTLRAAVASAAGGTPMTVEAPLAGGGTLRLSVRPMPGGSEPLLLAEGHDVTDYLALADRIAAEDAHRRRLVQAVGHDLKSPLAVLMALACRAQERGAGTDEIDGMLRAARSLGDRVDELLEDAREAEGGPAAPAPMDLARVVRATVDDVATLARERGIRVGVVAPRSCWVIADERRMDSVVANLAGNALRYAESAVEIRLETLGALARLTVSDDGPGVPARMREQIFERFMQSDDAGHTGAVGLGLAIVRDVVTVHGGSVRLGTSEMGGARFTVDLPRAGARERSSAPAMPEPADPFDSAPVGLGVIGARGHWERVNPPLAAMLGAPARELVGQPAARWMAPETADALKRTLAGRCERFEVQQAHATARYGRRQLWSGVASRSGAHGDTVVVGVLEVAPPAPAPAVNRRQRHRTRQPA